MLGWEVVGAGGWMVVVTVVPVNVHVPARSTPASPPAMQPARAGADVEHVGIGGGFSERSSSVVHAEAIKRPITQQSLVVVTGRPYQSAAKELIRISVTTDHAGTD